MNRTYFYRWALEDPRALLYRVSNAHQCRSYKTVII
jgi:hypothetical protein